MCLRVRETEIHTWSHITIGEVETVDLRMVGAVVVRSNTYLQTFIVEIDESLAPKFDALLTHDLVGQVPKIFRCTRIWFGVLGHGIAAVLVHEVLEKLLSCCQSTHVSSGLGIDEIHLFHAHERDADGGTYGVVILVIVAGLELQTCVGGKLGEVGRREDRVPS